MPESETDSECVIFTFNKLNVKVQNTKNIAINLTILNDTPVPNFDDPYIDFYNSVYGYAWKKITNPVNGKNHYLCLLCNNQLATMRYIYNHINVHYNRKCYECSYCDRKFYGTNGRAWHLRNTHGIKRNMKANGKNL